MEENLNKESYGQSNTLAEYIALQLKNKVSFRNALKKAIELTEQADTKKEIKWKLHGVSKEKKLNVLNGSEKTRFPSKPFKLKSIIVPI